MNHAISFNTPLDDETKEHIANALWMRTFKPEKIEEDAAVKLQDAKNSAQSFGTCMNAYFDWLLAHPQSHNPSYKRVIPLSSLYVISSRLIKLM